MKKYKFSDFEIKKSKFYKGYYASYPFSSNWPFSIEKDTVRDYVVEEVIENNYIGCEFPYCKTEEAAKMALITAIMLHNELVDKSC